VLVVGLGNSGAEIAKEVVRSHRTYVSGRSPGEVPFRMESLAGREIFSRLVIGVLFHHLLTLDTPLGRRAQPQRLSQATPLIRVRSKDLLSAGVELVPRTAGIAANGLPELEDGRMLDVANVIWCTGYRPGFEWIELPLTLDHGRPQQRRGVVADQPGLYFVGLEFEYAMSSSMVQGVSRDAAHVARLISAAQRPSTISTIDSVSHSAAA
jgi:putative flavoprotein involved in K+ transport